MGEMVLGATQIIPEKTSWASSIKLLLKRNTGDSFP